MLTQERLKNLLNYDPLTGIFTWKVTKANKPIGSIAGSGNNYITIQIDNKRYRAHRLAFLYMLGRLPKDEVDHIDRNPLNNAWNNLREVSHAENQLNKSNNINKRSGFTYITGRSSTHRWVVRLGKKYNEKYLGAYGTIEEAATILENALLEIKDEPALERFYKQLKEHKNFT